MRHTVTYLCLKRRNSKGGDVNLVISIRKGQCLKGTALFFVVSFFLVFSQPLETNAMGDPFDPMYSQVTTVTGENSSGVITENRPATSEAPEVVTSVTESGGPTRKSRKLITFYDTLMYGLGSILIIIPTLIYLFIGLSKVNPILDLILSKVLTFCQINLGEINLLKLTVHCIISGVVGSLFVTGIAKTLIARAWDFFYKIL